MPRPSRNVDRQLIRAARELMPRTGCAGLNIRQVAQRAKVNLGMFHYHFKTKDQFVRIVLDEIYEEMFQKLQLAVSSELAPLEALHQALFTLAKFACENRELLYPLVLDIAQGEAAVLRFIQKNFPRHVGFVGALIERCQQQKLIIPMPPLPMIVYFMSTVAIPSLIATGLSRNKKHSSPALQKASSQLVSDEAIRTRVEIALRGVQL